MQVPFLDLKAQYKKIRSEINPAIQEILDSSAFVLGKAVAEFENNFAKIHNAKYCIAVNSGTAGNHSVLWALGIKSGDEVIIPVNTFIATAWGATLCGAEPVFVDCESDSYNLDPAKVEAAITPKTKAIVAVHLYGQPADMNPLIEIAKKYNLFLVEDAAQAHLAEYKNVKVGNFGVATSFSFYPGKNLGAYGEAGAVVTNDDKIAEKVRMIRDHGTLQKYQHKIFGHNYRMEGIQGAVLNVKLNHLQHWTEARRNIAEKYKKLLSDVSEIKVPLEMPYSMHVYHLFVVQVNDAISNNNSNLRDKLANYLKEKGISTGLHYPIPLHLQECFGYLGKIRGDFPIAENLADSCLSLPMYPELTDEQIKYVTDNIKNYFLEINKEASEDILLNT